MLNLFGRKSQEVDGTELRYSPKLISKLQQEHGALLRLYRNIQMACELRDCATVSVLLTDLIAALNAHLFTEKVQLHVYLDHVLSRHDMKKRIHDCRIEMEALATAVTNLREQYEAHGADGKHASAFKKDFDSLGAILVESIRREESTVYPLYAPVQ